MTGWYFGSLYTFSEMDEVKEIIVVCDPSYKDIFEGSRSLSLSVFLPLQEMDSDGVVDKLF